MNIFDQYGIKEVADVTLYSIHKKQDGSGEVYYVPALYFDTLKISSVEKTAENVWAQGGLGNARLICWDYGKTINVSLEDALCTPASLGLCWGGILGADWKDGEVKQDFGISYNHKNPVERISRMEKAFYPRNDREKATISKLLPQAPYNRVENDLLLKSNVVDGTKVEGFGYVSNRPYKWKLAIESKIHSVAIVPDRFYDYYGNKYNIADSYPVIVKENLLYPNTYTSFSNATTNLSKWSTELTQQWKTLIRVVYQNIELSNYKKYLQQTSNMSDSEIEQVTADQVPVYEGGNNVAASTLSAKDFTFENMKAYYPYFFTVLEKELSENSITLATASKYKTGTIVTVTNIKPTDIDSENGSIDVANPQIDQVSIDATVDMSHETYIKRQIIYKINSNDSTSHSVNAQIILDQDQESIILTKDDQVDTNIKDTAIIPEDIQLLQKAEYLQILIDSQGNYQSWIGIQRSKDEQDEIKDAYPGPTKENPDAIALSQIGYNYKFQRTNCVNLNQFMGLDLWLRFNSINELIYFLLTKYEDNIVSIDTKAIQWGGLDTNNGLQEYQFSEDTTEYRAYLDGKLWCYVNPSTMTPYEDDYFFHQGEPYYKKSLTLSQNEKPLKAQRITVKAEQFPGMYMLIGETYIRSRDTGEDQRMQLKFPLCKVKSDQSLTLQADGDPTVFNLDLEIARPVNGIMMELTEYEVAEKMQDNEKYGYQEQFDGSTEILSE